MTAPHRPTPQHRATLEQYQRRAPYYDFELVPFEPARRETIARLALQPGDVVLDVGCGTGLSLAPLQQCVGPSGRIVGIEPSPAMLALARDRVTRHGWHNVRLLEMSAETACIAPTADAALFVFTHDVLRNPLALANVLASLRPTARIAACGLQWAGPWTWPLNLLVLGAALHSVTSLEGLDRPWSHLAKFLDRLQLGTLMAGTVFVVSGTLRRPVMPT